MNKDCKIKTPILLKIKDIFYLFNVKNIYEKQMLKVCKKNSSDNQN
jgi:hypothetical protein